MRECKLGFRWIEDEFGRIPCSHGRDINGYLIKVGYILENVYFNLNILIKHTKLGSKLPDLN